MYFDSNNRYTEHRLSALSLILCILVLIPCTVFGLSSSDKTVGPVSSKYQIHFQGNSFYSASQLQHIAKQELSDFDGLGQRKSEADDAAFQMSLAYKTAGFAFAIINYLYHFDEDPKYLTFLVEEGPRVVLKEIQLSGNDFFKDAQLLPFFYDKQHSSAANEKTYYRDTSVRSALDSIRDLYYGEGFSDVRIYRDQPQFSTDRESVTLAVTLEEGPRYIIRDIQLTGEILPTAEENLQKVIAELVGLPYFGRRKLHLRSSIIESYGNEGYPDVQVVFVEKSNNTPGDVILEVDIQTGPQVTISNVTLTGNEKTKEEFIRSRLALHTGDLYSNEKKRDSFQVLYTTGLFSRVSVNLTPTNTLNERILAIELEEADSRELSFEAGWGSYELLRFNLGFKDRNFLGTGRIIRTEEHFSFRSKSALVGLTDPWFLNTDITADLPFSYRSRQEPSFTQQDISTSILFSKKMSSSLLITLGYSFRITDITDIDPNTVLENMDSNYNLASLKLQASWDTRNDPFFPSSGYKHFVAVEAADEIILSEIALLRLTAGTRYFKLLPHNNVLGLRYSSGLIIPGRNQVTVPLAERFFNGGENTVRSFQEAEIGPLDLDGEPVGGMAFNIVSAEIRHRFSPRFAGTLFVDAGNVSPNRSRSEEGQTSYATGGELLDVTLREFFREFSYAVGVGVQYLLPVGPLRLDIAINPDPQDRGAEKNFMIHFSIGMAF